MIFNNLFGDFSVTMKEFKIWLKYTSNSFQQTLANWPTASILLVGKAIRVVLFLIFLGFLFRGTNGIAGYSRTQIIFFYLSFNLTDTLAQLFYREVYRFRQLVVSGTLDYVLVKPLNPLIRVLMGGGDILDLIMLCLLVAITTIFTINNFTINIANLLLYLSLIINGFVIATAFHILVLGIGVMTTSVDHMVMIYRDMTSMMRIPVDLYIEPIRFLLTFVLPLGIMITFPAKAFLGLLSWQLILLSLGFGITSFFLSLKFWNFAIKKYSSASS